jgi:FlaA1/EpsC-like NDP-sugar epimerase
MNEKSDGLGTPEIIKRCVVGLVLLTIPSGSAALMRRIVNVCHRADIIYRTVTSLNEIAAKRMHFSNIRGEPISVSGREVVLAQSYADSWLN